VRSRPGRRLLIGLAIAVAAPLLALAVALLATPGAGDLPRRVQLQARAHGAHPVALSAVTPLTVDALVATEDERFWRNSGIDVLGLIRAIPYDIAHLSLAQGGSTLTEQLAKNLWLGGSDQRAWTKLEDVALALKLNQRYSKNTILAAYLNTAYFGHGAYGIATASDRYFGLPPARLDASQATMLVGLVQAPTSYDPYTHPLQARQRQADVLRSLVRVGKLRPQHASTVLREPLRLSGGRVVPGIAGLDLSTGRAIAWPTMIWAIVAALGGLVASLLARRKRRAGRASRIYPTVAVCLFAIACVVAVNAVRVL
jgi:membrane peptidoglycan carboxypeptidase